MTSDNEVDLKEFARLGSRRFIVDGLARKCVVFDTELLDQASFRSLVSIERKRSERSGRPFLLLLVRAGDNLPAAKQAKMLAAIGEALSSNNRDTDLTGWYETDRVIGTIFTELSAGHAKETAASILTGVVATLREMVKPDCLAQLSISIHSYPEQWEHELHCRPSDPILYPDLSERTEARRFAHRVKRGFDIIGVTIALILSAPLFALIALAIKLTSEGPVFFKQHRVGEHGRPFVFLKFRSMRVNNDEGVHQQWFRHYITGKGSKQQVKANSPAIVKMTHDPRVTRIGRFLRRSSLDELPQFINVLKGEMSLVGPRPPIPYEVDAYEPWHRARVLQAKPGLTGLWQVKGRGRTTFDEMVRLDIEYARQWSLWLDLKLLLLTPLAVVKGEGAY